MTFPGLYDIYGVRGGAIIKSNEPKKNSPSENWLIKWGKDRRCDAVVRFFPSRKGYRLLDIRKAMRASVPNRPTLEIFYGQVRGTRYYPTVDAAVMAWLHLRAD